MSSSICCIKSLCAGASGARGRLLLGAHDVIHALRELGANADPVLQTVELNVRFGIGLVRIVGADLLDETAVARARIVGRNDVIKRAGLGATTGQTDDDHAALSDATALVGSREGSSDNGSN